MPSQKITLSVIKADVGSSTGHNRVHPALLEKARESLEAAKTKKHIVDYYVGRCGDDIDLIITHRHGVDSEAIHRLAWDTFMACTTVAKRLHLYGAGQDLLADAFAGNVKGMGPGVAEMEFVERPSEPIVVFMADKCSPGAWNFPLYRMFADPFTSAGLVIDPKMHEGFQFSVLDAKKEAFTFPHLVDGWMRGSHCGPLMPCAFDEANPTRFDGPPRVVAAGFQLADGQLVGPVDLFDDPSLDETRRKAGEVAEYMRRHGPFQPHRLLLEEMEYTTLPQVMGRLKDRFKAGKR